MSAILDPVHYTNKVNVEIKSEHIYEEHTNSLEAIKFSPIEAHKFATGSHDHTIKLWDVERATSISTLKAHEKGIWSLDWHPEGKLLASTSPDGNIVITDTMSGKTVQRIKASFEIGYSVEFSKQADLLVAAGLNGKLELYNTGSWSLHKSAEFPKVIIYAAKFNDAESRIVTCDSEGTISIFDRHLNKHYSKKLTTAEIRAFDLMGSSIVTSFETGDIKVFGYTQGSGLELIHEFKGHADQVNAIHNDSKNGYLFSGSKDGSIFAWKGIDFQFVHNLVGHIDQVSALDTNCDHTLLGSASWDQTARIYRIDDINKAT